MKRLAILSVLIFALGMVSAQRQKQVIKWFSIAPKATFGNSVLLNADIMGDKSISPDFMTVGYSYGGKFTYSFGQEHHFGLEYMLSSFGQKYGILTDAGESYSKIVSMTGSEISPYYRYRGLQGGFVDFGFKFSTLKTAQGTSEGVELARYDGSLMQYYDPKFTSMIFGFGMSFQIHERIDINGGLRFAYSLTDITASSKFNITDDFVYRPGYTLTATTNPVSAQFLLELNYYFAFYGDAKCGRGRLMFFQ